MADITRYVDTDAAGTGDGTSWTDAYTSWASCITGEAGDLGGDNLIVNFRASSNTADTSVASISGFSNYGTLTFQAASGDEAQKDGYKTDRYRIEVTDAYAVDIGQGGVIIDGLQIRHIYSATTFTGAVRFQNISETDDIIIKNCRIRGQTGSGDSFLINIGDDTAPITFESSIIEYSHRDLFAVTLDATLNIYNCVVAHQDRGTDNGIDGQSNTTVTNCAVFDTADDFDDASFTIDHCASDDGEGTNAVSPSGGSWDNEFNDPSGGDYTLLNTGNLYQGGTTITGGPSTDIDGDSWGSPPSIGADEYVSAGGTDALTADSLDSGAPVAASPTIGQVHVLVSVDLDSSTPVIPASTIGQVHALTAGDIFAGAPSLGTPTVAVIINGTVTLDGTARQGAYVDVLDHATGVVVEQTTTDVNGEYTLTLDAGTYRVAWTWYDSVGGQWYGKSSVIEVA